MSGVYARNRNLSSFEFFNTAVAIREEIVRFSISSAIPKSYRFVFSVPMCDTARSMVNNIVTSNEFYPNTDEGVNERKKYLTLAIADCRQLCQDIQLAMSLGLPIKEERLSNIADLLSYEIALLKGAKKNVKLIGGK